MPKTEQFYADFLKEWGQYGTRILSAITVGLRSLGLDVRDIKTEVAGGIVSWYMTVYPVSGSSKARDENALLINFQFSPRSPAQDLHMAGISVMDRSWADIEFFGLGEELDLADETAVAQVMQRGLDKVDEIVSVVRRQGPVKAYQIKDPETLSKEKLVRIVQEIQHYLYWQEDSGQMILSPEKETSGADLVESIDFLMEEYGLYPTLMGPKDWSPKKKP